MKRYLFLLLLVCVPQVIQSQTIGFLECEKTVVVGTPVDLPLVWQAGNVAGIIGADVRLEATYPAGWIAIVTPPPFVNPCGVGPCDLFGVGAELSWPSCVSNPIVTLFGIMLLPTTPVADVAILVRPTHNTAMGCPTVTLCDGPTFTKICVEVASTFINTTGVSPCTVAVAENSWAQVKSLYR